MRLVRDYRSTPQVVALANALLDRAEGRAAKARVQLIAQRPEGPRPKFSEHPDAPPGDGATFVSRVLTALGANAAVFNSTVMLINYDENGGFFDHVPPPVPPPGTKGEKLTVANLPAAAEGIRDI